MKQLCNIRAANIAMLCFSCMLSGAVAKDAELMGHWKLSGDVRDHSPSGNHGRNQNVNLTEQGPTGKANDAAGFDGRSSYVEVANSKSLQLGTGEFSISMWINTAEELDDVLGDLLSKYDPTTRTGFNLGIQNYAGVTSSQSNYRHVHFGIDAGKIDRQWTDSGRPGNNMCIFTLCVFDGQLFAGTFEHGKDQAGHVYRYAGGTKWIDCGSPDRCNAIQALAVFNGTLYAGAGRYLSRGSSLPESPNEIPGGKVYQYNGDDKWIDCGKLQNSDTGEAFTVGGMAVYRGQLYAGVSKPDGRGLYRYDGGKKWKYLGNPGHRVTNPVVYNGKMYFCSLDGGDVTRYDGDSKWTNVGKPADVTQTYGFAVYEGGLYVSSWPNGEVFRYDGDRSWISCGRLGEEKEVMGMAVYNGKLYAGTLPLAEVHRYEGATTWHNTGQLDTTPDVRYRRAWSMAVFQGKLFCGTLPSGHVFSIEAGKNVTYDHALPSGWVHLSAVRSADHLRLYVGGKLVATSAKFKNDDYNIANDKPLKIGFGAHDYFNGKLRDVRLYRGTLTDLEIKTLAACDDSASAQSSDRPPLRAAPGLFDSTNSKTLGLKKVKGTDTLLYRATDDGYKFCHHPNLIVFRDKLYCMWSNGLVSEDAPGQRILYCRSIDGRNWSEPKLLTDDKQGKGICVASGFNVADDRLVAYYTTTGGENFHPDTSLMARTSKDGDTWSKPHRITSGFFIEGPRRLSNGRLVIAGEHVGDLRKAKRMRFLYTDDRTGLFHWHEAQITPPELKVFGYTEPSCYVRGDGTIVATLRNNSGSLFATTSSDGGRVWSLPAKTNFPDSTARTSAGNLPSETAYLINNPGPKQFDRSLLTIAFSGDGTTFDRAYLIRGEPTKRRYDGKHKLDGWQYPNAIAWKDDLYVAYSINKEDVGLTRITLNNFEPLRQRN